MHVASQVGEILCAMVLADVEHQFLGSLAERRIEGQTTGTGQHRRWIGARSEGTTSGC